MVRLRPKRLFCVSNRPLFSVNYVSSIVKNFDARFGSTVASFYQHKELLEDEVWAAYLARVLGQKPGECIMLS